MKKMQEQTMRTLGLAIAGFAVLLVAAPDWARGGLLVFAAIFGALALAIDPNIKDSFRHRLGPRLHGDDIKKAEVKSPAARRAAT